MGKRSPQVPGGGGGGGGGSGGAPSKQTKEELLQMMDRVDRDIAATESQIAALLKKKVCGALSLFFLRNVFCCVPCLFRFPLYGFLHCQVCGVCFVTCDSVLPCLPSRSTSSALPSRVFFFFPLSGGA